MTREAWQVTSMILRKLENLFHFWRGKSGIPIWYDPSYRFPVTSLEARTGIDSRRADYAAWYLLETRKHTASQLHMPHRISYEHLALVHTDAYLESLSRPDTLAAIFGVEPSDIPVDEVLNTVRRACGGTLAAARRALESGRPCLNLLGGFHKAGPDFGSRLCTLSDIAVALAVLRAEGFDASVAVLDFDVHTPDGLVACLASDPKTRIGTLSVGRECLDGVDSVEIPEGCEDERYLEGVAELLDTVGDIDLAFVIAGGDVLIGDRSTATALTLKGARNRDLAVARKLSGVASVWLPGGGYHRDSWKVLAGTALVLSHRALEPIPDSFDPMSVHFESISHKLEIDELEGPAGLTLDDITEVLRMETPEKPKLLGWYTTEGVEYALHQFGIVQHIERLGFSQTRVVLERGDVGDRIRLMARMGKTERGTGNAEQGAGNAEQGAGNAERTVENAKRGVGVEARGSQKDHVLIDCLLERQVIDGATMLYVHWLALQNPIASFGDERPRLPGQEQPGLGLARESGAMLIRIARRLRLDGLAYRPAWYHSAYAGRYELSFADPVNQGRFEAMMRDFADTPLQEVSIAMSEGRVTLNGDPYQWQADVMGTWFQGRPYDDELVRAERGRVRFAIVDPHGCGENEQIEQ